MVNKFSFVCPGAAAWWEGALNLPYISNPDNTGGTSIRYRFTSFAQRFVHRLLDQPGKHAARETENMEPLGNVVGTANAAKVNTHPKCRASLKSCVTGIS